jgi:predicted nucleic acid-binding Zn ribbon protein
MDVINQIRRDNGVHTDIMHLLEDSPLANTIHSLKANLRRSLTAYAFSFYLLH